MEVKPEVGGVKVLENLKRHLFDFQETASSPSKPLSSREVCTSLADLVGTVSTAVFRPGTTQLVSNTVELLVHACSSEDRAIRLAASENLRKLIKWFQACDNIANLLEANLSGAPYQTFETNLLNFDHMTTDQLKPTDHHSITAALMNSHLARLQQDLFHELKKNGSSRSLCAALDCFASLFPYIRPSRCNSYAQALLPVLVRVTGREEEALHESLQEAFGKILPTMTPFLSTANLQFLMTGLIQRLPKASPSYRRMAALALHGLTIHSRQPLTIAEWLINKLLDMGCGSGATSELVQGVLLTMQQLFSNIKLPLDMLKQAYAFMVSCLLYRDANTSISSLEALHQLLVSTTAEMAVWLITPLPTPQVTTDFWTDGNASDTTSDTHSLGDGLETPCDLYFESEDLTLSFAPDGKDKGHVVAHPAPDEMEPPAPARPPAITGDACLATPAGPSNPLGNIIHYILNSVLPNMRVSAQSLGLACVTAAVDISPLILPTLEPLEMFALADDPKLRCRFIKLIGMIIYSHLRANYGDFTSCPAIVSDAKEKLCTMLKDSTPVVLRAACEALQLCLPALIKSSRPALAVTILHKLLPLHKSSYWLTKVELLQALSCLEFNSLAMTDSHLPDAVLKGVVFTLLADSDHRVRTAACEAIVSVASCLQLTGQPLLGYAQWEGSHLFSHLHSKTIQLSLAGIADSTAKALPRSPMGLEHLLWFLLGNISSSVDRTLQRGCLEALYHLSLHYPPPSFPDLWGCVQSPCTLIAILQELLRFSRLAWGVQAHCEILELSGSVFLGCALANMQLSAQSGQSWSALSEPSLVSHAGKLLNHTVKLLSIFVHIIEHREPEPKESRRLTLPVSPRRPSAGDTTSPGKTKPQIHVLEALQRPPLVPKDGIGHFASIPHFLKIMDACKAAYTNYQVSLAPVGEDKFSKLLHTCHNTLAALLEVALANDVGKNVEELLSYLAITVKVDFSGSLLCVQQLLNALFGMNAAAQHTHLYSPYISSLPYDIITPPSSPPSSSLYDATVLQPLSLMKSWLQAPPPSPLLTPSEEQTENKKSKFGIISSRRSLVVKPVNPVSSIKDYIGHFEPLVVLALRQFSYTSSLLLQQRVLFLLVQLLHLKVRYELLDCNHAFLDSAMKLVDLMEHGAVKGGERLVPHLFQFLVLLANDQSKLVTVPQVMQKCDGVMASGHNVGTFAIPALQPLVLNLFVRPTRVTEDLEIQREVVVNMLLRLVEHSRVMVLLTYVLDCYRRNTQKWQEVSNQIYAAILPHIGKLNVLLDSSEDILALYHLFTAMDPSTISVQALFTAMLKQHSLTSLGRLIRWLGVVCTVLELMVTIFPETTLFNNMGSQLFRVPELECALVSVEGQSIPGGSEKPTQLAMFLQGILHLAASTLNQLTVKRCSEDYQLLPTLIVNIMLLLQILVQDPYQLLKTSLSCLPPNPTLNKIFLELASSQPLLTLHYATLTLHISTTVNLEWVLQLLSHSPSSTCTLLQHSTLLLVCELCSPEEAGRAAAQCPALMEHCQEASVKSFLTAACKDEGVQQSILEAVQGVDNSNPVQCMQAIWLCVCVPSCDILRYLCSDLVTHPLPTVSVTAANIALQLISSLDSALTAEVAAQLAGELKPHKESCSNLFAKLCEISDQPVTTPELLSPTYDPLTRGNTTLNVQEVTKSWYLDKVQEFCSSPHVESEVCARVLGSLELEEVREIIESDTFPLLLLECCIVRGVKLTLNRSSKNSFDQIEFPIAGSQPPQLHPLLRVSADHLLVAVKTDYHDLTLIRPLVYLLSSRHLLPSPISIENEVAESILTMSLHSFTDLQGDPLALRLALDCCSLALQTPEICCAVTDKWVCQTVHQLYETVKTAFPTSKMKTKSSKQEKQLPEADKALEKAAEQLRCILDVLLHPASEPTSYILHMSLEMLAFTISRHPLVNTAVMLPPALLGEGTVSDKVLDQAVMESEILHQLMQRCNPIGWLSRHQFEERWMQLLGVVNQPPPPEGTPQEESHAYMLNVCAGVQAVTSLLLGTSLRPSPGDPITSIPLHTHRNSDVLFLGSRPGRKLAYLRCLLEMQLLLHCGQRSNIYSYYQAPLLHNVSSPHYPPLYTRNVERLMGDTSTGPGQMSVNSLWPIMLMSTTSMGRPEEADVDIRSCILSLIDLYTHWLSLPIHTLLLQHMLSSVIMLSDLFAVSGQFSWMLATLLDLYDHHPSEDTTTTALLVQGVLKAAAVLKVDATDAEKIAKIVEKSLSSDSTIPVQNACLRGLLYVLEDSNSTVVPLVGPTLAKYIPANLQTFPRFTESHTKLVWSVAVSAASLHSHHMKDLNFTSHLLDCVVPLLFHPHTSTALFHSITTGLELMVITFALMAKDRTSIARTAANRFNKCDQGKSLALLALLITCMYTGEEADVVSGLADMDSSSLESALQAREQISNLMERVRHGPLMDVSFLIDVLPQLVVDFLPPMEVLQTVVTEFVSPHQTRPELAACVMAEAFYMLLKRGQQAVVTEWVVLSLESFVQQEPEKKAVWSIACLLTAASTNDKLRSMFTLIAHWQDLPEHQAVSMLCTAVHTFYAHQCIQHQNQVLFLDKFRNSKYASLKQVAYYCLHI